MKRKKCYKHGGVYGDALGLLVIVEFFHVGFMIKKISKQQSRDEPHPA
jgi:beta-galactosidase/beta-glucuronidase